jgi:arylsulfatase A-like enzyme
VDPFKDGEPMPAWHIRQHRVRRIVQSDPVYAAMVENLDWSVGRLLDALQRTGKADDYRSCGTSTAAPVRSA